MVVHIDTIIFNVFASSKFFYLWKTQGSKARALEQDKTWYCRVNAIEIQIQW